MTDGPGRPHLAKISNRTPNNGLRGFGLDYLMNQTFCIQALRLAALKLLQVFVPMNRPE